MSNIADVMHERSCWISISFDIEREMHFKDAVDIFSIHQETQNVQLLT